MSENRNLKKLIPDVAFLSIAIGLLVYLYFDAIAKIANTAQTNDDYSHGVLLPFIAAYIIWDRRDKFSAAIRDQVSSSSTLLRIFAVLMMILGAIGFLAWTLADLVYLGWLSFFLSVGGILLISLRPPLRRILFEPIMLLFLAHPIPASLVPRLFNPLQHLAAVASKYALELCQVPVYVQGNIIEIPSMRLLVEEACSGLRSVLAMATVGILMPMLFKMTAFGRIALFIIAIFIALVLNIFRVVATGVLAHFYDRSVAEGFFHEFTGMVVFIVGIALVYFLMNFFIKDEPSDSEEVRDVV